jgi:hypothetical protein
MKVGIEDLIGKTLGTITGLGWDSYEATFYQQGYPGNDLKIWKLMHHQSPSNQENVRIVEVVGSASNVVGAPISLAVLTKHANASPTSCFYSVTLGLPKGSVYVLWQADFPEGSPELGNLTFELVKGAPCFLCDAPAVGVVGGYDLCPTCAAVINASPYAGTETGSFDFGVDVGSVQFTMHPPGYGSSQTYHIGPPKPKKQ